MIWLFNSVIPEFLYGVLVAIAWLKDRIKLAPAMLVLGVIAYGATVSCFFHKIDVGREFKWGLLATLLVYGAVGIPWKAPRFAVLVGYSSYILYLMHTLLIATINVLSIRLLEVNASIHNGLVVLILVLSVAISMATTVWIERPIAWYKRRVAQTTDLAKSAVSGTGLR